MADEQQAATEPTESVQETATPIEEKRFSQADVDRVVQERLARERRGAPKDKPRAPEASKADDDRLTLKQLNDSMHDMKVVSEFDRLALRAKLSETQADRLMPLYRAARNAGGDGFDGGAWLRDFQEAFGGGQTVKPTPARTAATGQPVSDAGSPAPASASVDDGTPLWQMKPEDRQHLIKTKGLAWYTNAMRSQLKGTRFSLRKP